MHTMAGECKMLPSRDRPSSAIFHFTWCGDKENSFGIVVLQRRPVSVETWLCSLAKERFSLVVFYFICSGYLRASWYGVHAALDTRSEWYLFYT
jgi:hypothetical protein